MRRSLLPAALATAALAALAAQAGAAGSAPAGFQPVFRDPVGDWAAPGQDLVAGQARLADGQVTVRLRTAGTTLVREGQYVVDIGLRAGRVCHDLVVAATVAGAELRVTRSELSRDCDAPYPPSALLAYLTGPSDGTVVSDAESVTITVPAPSWLTPGSRAGVSAVASNGYGVQAWLGVASVTTFDLAGGSWRIPRSG